jgi:hypothetical protein
MALNVALHHQLEVLQRSVGRPRLRRQDRLFGVGLRCLRVAVLVRERRQAILARHERVAPRRRSSRRSIVYRDGRDSPRRSATAALG